LGLVQKSEFDIILNHHINSIQMFVTSLKDCH